MPGLHVFVELLKPDALISVIAKERDHLHVEIHSKRIQKSHVKIHWNKVDIPINLMHPPHRLNNGEN